jgi:hypothetical protein
LTGGTWQADIAIDNINLSSSNAAQAEEVLVDDLSSPTQTIENSVRFYPNPAGAYVNVDLGFDMAGGPVDVTMTIYDLTGKVVQQSRWPVASTTSQKQMDISALSNGIYMINIRASNGLNKMQKLIKK